MTFYGGALAEFLDASREVADLPFLGDVARLEYAVRQAYHAADASPIDPQALLALPPERLVRTRIGLAPAVRVLRSAHPVHTIWAESGSGRARVGGESGAQCVTVSRPGFDPVADPVGPGAADFVDACLAGAALGDAAEAGAADPAFDLTAIIGLLLQREAITALSEEARP
jgi:hypothetical protein